MTSKSSRPFVLAILDGWGVGPHDASNAIWRARTPHYDSYLKRYAWTELEASSTSVGLPKGQDGNSEAGHMNIGAGRIVEQDSVTISKSISDGTFFKNPAFLQTVHHVRKNNSNVHLMGLLSNGQSAHSHPDHLIALITYFRYQRIPNIFLHLFTDGRDSAQYEAIKLLRRYQRILSSRCTVATIIGRAYAMDRKKDWRRTEVAYDAIVRGKGLMTASSAEDAVLKAYARGETDEFIKPTVITRDGKPVGTIDSNDAIVFMNLRSDRARQMAKPFVQIHFEEENVTAFTRQKVLKNISFIAMTDFGPDLDSILTAYPSRDTVDALPSVLNHLKQYYIAEGEKYAHVTYFFNGGYDRPIAGETRVLVPSPDALNYSKFPKMSLGAITTKMTAAIRSKAHDFFVVNVSNADMIAHTGDIEATVKAVEYVDSCLDRIVKTTLTNGGTMILTADHGNAEELVNRRSGEIDTEHSTSRVPFIIIRNGKKLHLQKRGILADVAPTILALLKIKQPPLMTGKNLIV